MKNLNNLFFIALLVGTLVAFYGCQKDSEIPTLNTIDVSGITANTAVTGGTVISGGGTDVISRGVCWSTDHNPTLADNYTTDGNGLGTFSSNLTGLNPNTQYYVRAYATNSSGRAYGEEISFTSGEAQFATVKTAAIIGITSTSALSGGEILSNGGAPVVYWGICWNTSPNPDIENSWTYGMDARGEGKMGAFISILSGLNPATMYYVRAFASNSAGVAYGDQLSFTTANVDEIGSVIFNTSLTYGLVSDIDGNIYKTIKIGTQTWMAENLKTTTYSDGTPVPNVTDGTDWESLSTPGYCWYNNDGATYKSTYGALYNWYAVKTDKLCPTGWHVPSNDEWNTLIRYLGGEIAAGVKVIETGNTHWLRTIIGATNETGFTALPGGFRSISNDFRGFTSLGYFGLWWTTTDYTPPYDALVTQLPSYDFSDEGHWGLEAGFAAKKIGGVSVRCVKN